MITINGSEILESVKAKLMALVESGTIIVSFISSGDFYLLQPDGTTDRITPGDDVLLREGGEGKGT